MSKKKSNDISKDFEVDPANVKDEYTRVPAYLATLNQVYAQALRTAILAKFNRDKTFALQAEIFLEDEKARQGSSYKKPGAELIKNAVYLTREYQTAVERYAEAEYEKAAAGGASQAMVAKKDMLVSLGAHVRQELDFRGGDSPSLDDDDEDKDEDGDDDND